MEYQQASPATTLSKKLSNGGGLTGKHIYDGVFGSPLKPGSRMEDYREIFGGSATCSIPILDFPELKEGNTSMMEARSKNPDYSTIFGGFEEAEFAVPYEELFSKPKRVKNSSQQARIPIEASSRPEGPKHSNIAEEKRGPSPEVSFQSFDEVKQFSVSYNKSHLGSKNGTKGATHIAQLHAVPGYTCLIDEVAPQQVTDDGGKPVHTALNDALPNAVVSEGIKASKPVRKVVSGPQPRAPTRNTSNTSMSNPEIQKKSRTKSFSNDISFDTFDIGLGTQPSTMSPSNIGCDKDNFRSINSKFEVFGNKDSKDAAGSYSPPPLDEEMDTNSAAAASAAAVRKAIQEAQLKIKIAKELMERRKQGLQSRAKSSSNDGLKAMRREMKVKERENRSKGEAQKMHLTDCSPKQVFNGLAEHSAIRSTWDFRNGKNATGETQSTAAKWAQVDSRLEAKSGKATKGFSEPAGTVRDKETTLEVNQEINVEKMKPSINENECKEKMTEVGNVNKSMNSEKKLEVSEKVSKEEKVQMQLNSIEAAFQWDIYRHSTKSAEEHYQLEESDAKVGVAYEHDEAPQIPDVTFEQEEYKSTVRQLCEPEETAKFAVQDLEGNEDIEESRVGQDQLENEKRQREADNQEEIENQSHEVPVREENEEGLDEVHCYKGNNRGQKEDLDGAECAEKQPDHRFQEENEKRQNVVPKPDDAENLVQVHTEEVIGVKLNCFQEKEESEKRQRENCETKSIGNLEEAKENEGVLKEHYLISETERHDNYEDAESERIQTEIHLGSEGESNMEMTQGTFRYQENNLKTQNHAMELDENKKPGKADERTIDSSSPEETGKGTRLVEEADDQLEEENIETGDTEEGPIGLGGSKKQIADIYSGETDLNLDHKHNKYHVTEYERFCELKNHFEEVTSQSDENDQYVSDSEIGFNNEQRESSLSSNEERQLGKRIETEMLCDPEKQVEEVYHVRKFNQDMKEPEVAINHEEYETFFESSSQEKWVNTKTDVQASQGPHIFEREEKNMEVSQEEGEEKKVQVSQEERTNGSVDKEEDNYQETQTVENRQTDDNLQKEGKLGKKHHERMEEAKIREMEKEKERIAVERAIREARERAFAEARERAAAERAAAEAHQKIMAEARGKLEKVCSEANGKSAAEKVSIEAKLKAERAAVERATAEARERALEKALSEKASFKQRNQAEKSATEKFSGASKDSGIKSSDLHSKVSGPSSSSRYQSFSNNDVPSSTERFSAANGESAERFKATFERNQRTAERAAKALAEKNLRDLLAQKEQAERNRLAQVLDADVKRWSSGKERNLRALLSTLQYILGSDSGWQPIPLTDLVSTAAVKKAYRKATLFVHPDKLQQRGASIQQKYTCEKVFDLLKEAWNKFSAEER